jgi:hypothetical protein
MDKKNVQKSIWRNLFAQKRAALGDLRNFFGDHFARPYMVRGHAPILNTVCGGQCQKGGFPEVHVPFLGFLVFGKKVLAFWGLSSVAFQAAACPFLGVSCFRKKGFGVFGTVFGGLSGCGMSLFGGFLFPENKVGRFQGVIQSFSDPSSGSSSSLSSSKSFHEW